MALAGALAGGALLGGIGGMFSSGPQLDTSGLKDMGNAYGAYQNLVNAGPGMGAVTAATQAQQNLAQTYQNDSNNPMNMYNFAAGNQLAQQEFGAQRQQLASSLQQQINQAQQAAASAGRSVYDPILQSRLRSQSLQQNAALNAQQSSAAVGYAGQIGQQQLQNQVNGVNVLTGLGNQAFQGQQSLFSMGQGIQGSNLQAAQYEEGQGGGIKGALTGMAGGLGAGAQIMGAITNMQGAGAMQHYFNSMTPGGMQSNALQNFQFNPNGMRA